MKYENLTGKQLVPDDCRVRITYKGQDDTEIEKAGNRSWGLEQYLVISFFEPVDYNNEPLPCADIPWIEKPNSKRNNTDGFNEMLNHDKAYKAEKEDIEVFENNAVNSPFHYQIYPDMQAIDVIRKALTLEEFKGYCKGNSLKYRLRLGKKDAVMQDLGKAEIYEGWLK